MPSIRQVTTIPPGEAHKAWVICKPLDEEDELRWNRATMGEILGHDICAVRSPEAMVGMPPPEPRQRVVQVALGVEHGVLLTDAGIACTWGDNRYGQLGRDLCLKEENGQPFPVVHVQHDEITMVASGKHHCLALAAAGHVWAWGRNKAGQLGIGTFRDMITPEKVKQIYGELGETGDLGSKEGCEIISINAGCSSSVASAVNSDVWQWGEISLKFRMPLDDKKGGHQRKSSDEEYSKRRGVQRNYPHLVFTQKDYRTQLRQDRKVSIMGTGCRVTPDNISAPDLSKIQGTVLQVSQLRVKIAKDRLQLSKNVLKMETSAGASGGHDSGSDHRSLQDTIAMFQREILDLNRLISATEKDLMSCELQQEHNRKQLANLSLQSTKLSKEQDDASLALTNSKQGAADRKQQERRLANIREFAEANQNTRMTLLDQRAETDKNKQRVNQLLFTHKAARDKAQRHLDTVKEMGNSNWMSRSIGHSDGDIQFLRDINMEIKKRFDVPEDNDHDIVTKKAVFEEDHRFLDTLEMKAKIHADGSPNLSRAKVVRALLQDIIDLRRRGIRIKENRLLAQDLDVSHFWTKASSTQSQPGPS